MKELCKVITESKRLNKKNDNEVEISSESEENKEEQKNDKDSILK